MRVLIIIFIATLGRICTANAAKDDAELAAKIYYPENIVCKSTKSVHKCARLPTANYNSLGSSTEFAHITAGTVIDEINWGHFRNGVQITGYATNINVTSNSWGALTYYQTHATCVVTEPFVATFSVSTTRSPTIYNGAQSCTRVTKTVDLESTPLEALVISAQAHNGDVCPDGFFTVPWESWCGEGMVNVSDAVSCDSDLTDAMYCLMPMGEALCEIGVSNLKTSTGLSFSLYAEKYTEPSLAVQYNGQICWAKLEAGQVSNSTNVNYQDTIYHVVD